jgi:septum formation protein
MPLWIASKPLLLASKSEVRRKILAAAGVPIESRPAPIDERAIEARSHVHEAGEVARVLAGAKAHTVAAQMPARVVLGADQTLTLGEKRFSKPTNRDGAREQLLALRGQTHRLHSALTLVRDGEVLFEYSDVAELTVRTFSDRFLESYLDSVGESAFASVGGYQIESAGIHLFEKISGDYFTILGLPLLPLLGFLRKAEMMRD